MEMTLLNHGFCVRLGTPADVDTCDRIARQQEQRQRSALGWVRKSDYRTFHVAMFDGRVVGFVLYHTPTRGSDFGFQVIHTLAVMPEYEGMGIGRNLLYSVEHPVRLRCPQTVNGGEHNPANAFYANAGMTLIGVETEYRGGMKKGQVRANSLNVWERYILPVLVQGNNAEMPRVARESGWAYGTRAAEKPRDWAYQVDLEFSEDWRAFDWDGYMAKVRAWKPVAALALDYFERAQLPTLLAQIADLKAAGVLRVLVCPKFHGAVADIPADCIVAISVPSTYAGFVPDFAELRGRKVHLLGGSPPKWFGSRRSRNSATGYIAALQGAGARVISVDGNAHTGAAEQGGVWQGGVWDFKTTPLDLYGFMVTSGRNIGRDLHQSAEVRQEALWG